MEEYCVVDYVFKNPHGIVRCKDRTFFVSDQFNARIVKLVETQYGMYSSQVVAGVLKGYQDGIASEAQFHFIGAIALDLAENVYIADASNNKIRVLSKDGMVSTFIPRSIGNNEEIQLNNCRTLAIDKKRQHLYCIDDSKTLFKIHIDSRICVATVPVNTDCAKPRGLVIDNENNIHAKLV